MLTWDDILTFDDIIFDLEREAISELEQESGIRCPHLGKEDDFFYYCALNMPLYEDTIPNPMHPVYLRHVSLAEMSIDCMNTFEACCFYKGTLKR